VPRTMDHERTESLGLQQAAAIRVVDAPLRIVRHRRRHAHVHPLLGQELREVGDHLADACSLGPEVGCDDGDSRPRRPIDILYGRRHEFWMR
jgi:hypothetical protein